MQLMRLEYSLNPINAMFDVSRCSCYIWLRSKPGKKAQAEPRLVARSWHLTSETGKHTARNGPEMI
jgi:hypothetical protein